MEVAEQYRLFEYDKHLEASVLIQKCESSSGTKQEKCFEEGRSHKKDEKFGWKKGRSCGTVWNAI